MTQDVTPKFLSERLAAKIDEVVQWLLPAGQRIGPDWCVGSVKGEAGKSLKIAMEGDKLGRWCDFSQGDKVAGDLLDLVAQTQGIDLGSAMREACKFLGIERNTEWGARKQKYAEPKRPENARGIAKSPQVGAWLAARKIGPEVQARYKLIADGDGVVVFPYFRGDKLLHLKYRTVREKKFWASAGTEPLLFGWQGLAPGIRSVLLTEGELDTLSFAEYGLQALSIPFGAGKGEKHTWIENEWDHLERFDTIFLALDMDGPGLQTTQELAERLGRHRVKVVKLPKKDANECLTAGVPKAQIMRCISEAKTLDPMELRNSADFTDQIMERFHPSTKEQNGFLLPWLEMHDQFIFGRGETTIIAGYTSHGKTEIVGQLVLDAGRQGEIACIASLEFKPDKWLARQVRQLTNEETPSRAAIQTAMDWLGQRTWVIDTTAKTGTTSANNVEAILSAFAYAHRRYGVRLFVIDPFLKLGIGEDDLNGQKAAIDAITTFAVRYNVHVILVHHMRKAEDDSAARLTSLSLRGSSSLSDMCDNIWLVWRNKPKERKLRDPSFNQLSPEEQIEIRDKPDTVMMCEKYRTGDLLPRMALWFDVKSHTFQDTKGAPPVRYLKDLKVTS